MNDKRRILILLKILDQIQQDNQDARNAIEKPITTTRKEEGISFEQVFYTLYILFFIVVFTLSFFHSRSTDNFLNSLSAVICDDMNSSLAVWINVL